MSHIAVFEPVGLAHADRIALALMRLERSISGTPATLIHLDPNLRGLTSSSSGPAWTGLSGSTANLSAALSTLARGKRPMLQATPLPQGEGQMIWPGALLEEAWQEASLAVARTFVGETKEHHSRATTFATCSDRLTPFVRTPIDLTRQAALRPTWLRIHGLAP